MTARINVLSCRQLRTRLYRRYHVRYTVNGHAHDLYAQGDKWFALYSVAITERQRIMSKLSYEQVFLADVKIEFEKSRSFPALLRADIEARMN